MWATSKYSVDSRCNSKHQFHFLLIICLRGYYFFFNIFATICPRCDINDRESKRRDSRKGYYNLHQQMHTTVLDLQ